MKVHGYANELRTKNTEKECKSLLVFLALNKFKTKKE